MFRDCRGGEDITTETELVASLVCFLKSDGYRIRLEVPNLAQSADIVATRGRWVTFIEAKLGGWRRAIEQCQGHVHVADYICIALATTRVSEALAALARDCGYGIIHVDRRRRGCCWMLHPRLNRRVWPPERQRWATNLRKIKHVD